MNYNNNNDDRIYENRRPRNGNDIFSVFSGITDPTDIARIRLPPPPLPYPLTHSELEPYYEPERKSRREAEHLSLTNNSVPTRIFAVIRFETRPQNTSPLVNIISVHRSLATANAEAEFFWQQGEARERGRRDRRDEWFSASGEVNNEGHVKWRHVEVVEGSGLVGTTSTRATIFVIVFVKTFPSSTSNNISDTPPPVANIISVHASLATANKAAEDFWRKEALRFLSSEREDERGHFGAVGELALDGNGRPLKWCCVRVEAMKVDD